MDYLVYVPLDDIKVSPCEMFYRELIYSVDNKKRFKKTFLKMVKSNCYVADVQDLNIVSNALKYGSSSLTVNNK